ncbi:hypothetical protein TFLX_00758 [Thermoflexales bacterium]|nr:hypothetical protein TFLX_00758 [Thermoflexales bacterium]
MKTVPRVILIGILLVLSIIAVLPVSAGRSLSPTVFQSGIDTPTLPPVASNTPEPAATNTPEPAATNTPVPAATSTVVPPATPTLVPPTLPPPVYTIIAYWTVQPGQTLYCIGRYYKVSPWAIASANRIPWPYYLYLGQVIAIPNVPWYNIPPGPVCYPGTPNITPTPPGIQTPTPPPANTPTPVPGACRYRHLVQWGQTLSGIAWYYRTTIQAILYANPSIINPNLIYAGSTLCIP